MYIDKVGYNPVQARQQVGFGTKVRLADKVIDLVKDTNEAEIIARIIKKAEKDGKNFILNILTENDDLYGKVYDTELNQLCRINHANVFGLHNSRVATLVEIIVKKLKDDSIKADIAEKLDKLNVTKLLDGFKIQAQ